MAEDTEDTYEVKILPKPEEKKPFSPWDLVNSPVKTLGPMPVGNIVRVGSGLLGSIASAEPGAGTALGGTLAGGGEALAEKIEGSELDPRRIGAEALIGMIPFGKFVRAGNIPLSAGLGAVYSGLGMEGRKLAKGESLIPTKEDVGNLGTGTAMGGIAGGISKLVNAYRGIKSPTVPPGGDIPVSKAGDVTVPRPIADSPDGLRIAAIQAKKGGALETSEQSALNKAAEAAKAALKNKKAAELVFPSPLPNKLVVMPNGSVVPAEAAQLTKGATEAESITRQAERAKLAEASQEARNLNSRDQFNARVAKDLERARVAAEKQKMADAAQLAKNLNEKDKFIAGDQAQTAKNLDARAKFIDADAAQTAKNLSANAAAEKIQEMEKGLEPRPPTVTERVSAGDKTATQTFAEPPPDEENLGDFNDDGTLANRKPRPLQNDHFPSFKAAKLASLNHPGTVVQEATPGSGIWKVVPEGFSKGENNLSTTTAATEAASQSYKTWAEVKGAQNRFGGKIVGAPGKFKLVDQTDPTPAYIRQTIDVNGKRTATPQSGTRGLIPVAQRELSPEDAAAMGIVPEAPAAAVTPPPSPVAAAPIAALPPPPVTPAPPVPEATEPALASPKAQASMDEVMKRVKSERRVETQPLPEGITDRRMDELVKKFGGTQAAPAVEAVALPPVVDPQAAAIEAERADYSKGVKRGTDFEPPQHEIQPEGQPSEPVNTKKSSQARALTPPDGWDEKKAQLASEASDELLQQYQTSTDRKVREWANYELARRALAPAGEPLAFTNKMVDTPGVKSTVSAAEGVEGTPHPTSGMNPEEMKAARDARQAEHDAKMAEAPAEEAAPVEDEAAKTVSKQIKKVLDTEESTATGKQAKLDAASVKDAVLSSIRQEIPGAEELVNDGVSSTVTIDVPGDGTFTIPRDPQALTRVADKIEKDGDLLLQRKPKGLVGGPSSKKGNSPWSGLRLKGTPTEVPPPVEPTPEAAPVEAPSQAAPPEISNIIPVSALKKSPLDVAGEHYGSVKAELGPNPKSQKGTPLHDGYRVAGTAASRMAREASPFAPGFKDDVAALESLSPAARKKAVAAMLKSEKGVSNPEVLSRIALSGIGGALGGAEGRKSNFLGNKTASTIGGALAGAALPAVFSELPQISESIIENQDRLSKFVEKANKVHNVGLLSPLSVAKKALGDIGGVTSAGIENPDRIGSLLKTLLSRENLVAGAKDFGEGFRSPVTEDLTGLDNMLQNPKNPLGLSGKSMGGLTQATKGMLERAGFTPEEAKYYTFTQQPTSGIGKAIYAPLSTRTKAGQVLQHFSPFAKIGINRAERGFERSPAGLLNMLSDKSPEDIRKTIRLATQGTAAIALAHTLTPPDFVKKHPIESSLISAAAGPYGLPVIAGMALKGHGKDLSITQAAKAVTKDLPGFRLIEELSSSPFAYARNYLSGYTNVTRPAAELVSKVRGINSEPDVNSKRLKFPASMFNQTLANVPFVRDTLQREKPKLSAPKFTIDLSL